VSNLPTVWSNTLVGLALGGLLSIADGTLERLDALSMPPLSVALTAVFAMSLFYIGGMFLNDAFDATIDAIERPERPIPSGDVSRLSVFTAGFALLIGGVVMVAILSVSIGGKSQWAIISSIALGVCIVAYNAWHKSNPLSPLVMGMCRVLVYTTTAFLLTQSWNLPMVLAAVGLLSYLAGLTAIAKQENLARLTNWWPLCLLFLPAVLWLVASPRTALSLLAVLILVSWILVSFRILLARVPGSIPKAVGAMLAGISLVDAVALASLASWNSLSFWSSVTGGNDIFWILLCFVCFALTVCFQRVIPGT